LGQEKIMATEQNIRSYQQRCYRDYSSSIELPKDYRYPTGNPIQPVLPVHTKCGGIMIIGAYPSARFESRQSLSTGRRRLIPIADNLQPFGTEVYFDGTQVRRLESAHGLNEFLLSPLVLKLEDCWVTDLVKVFLYKQEHYDSCSDAVLGFSAPVLRDQFSVLAERSLRWIRDEYRLCEPQIIITLGEEVARAVFSESTSTDELLSVQARHPDCFNGTTTFCCPHPDGCRRSPKWKVRMSQIVARIKDELKPQHVPPVQPRSGAH